MESLFFSLCCTNHSAVQERFAIALISKSPPTHLLGEQYGEESKVEDEICGEEDHQEDREAQGREAEVTSFRSLRLRRFLDHAGDIARSAAVRSPLMGSSQIEDGGRWRDRGSNIPSGGLGRLSGSEDGEIRASPLVGHPPQGSLLGHLADALNIFPNMVPRAAY